MKKSFKIKGMHCNSCAQLIENDLKDKVNKIRVSYADEEAIIEFDEKQITEKQIIQRIKKLGYDVSENKNINQTNQGNPNKSYKIGLVVMFSIIALALILFYFMFLKNINLPEFKIPSAGENISLILILVAGLLTGFHCISMCGGFVVSYTAKNALNGHKSFKQHLVYGAAKVFSYAIIGGIFGLIGGVLAFNLKMRGGIAIFAGLFMIFYALSMFGIKFFRKFQFNPKFLSKISSKTPKGPYAGPFFTGLLTGLFIACGPLQAMYLYAAGTGSFLIGLKTLAVFGIGTLPVMLGFGSLTTVISHKTTKKILKLSAIIVLILGIVMLNRGLTLLGSPLSYNSIKTGISASGANSITTNGVQEINMNVDASGWKPNSFVLKKGIPVKWNINVIQLTGCNREIIVKDYNLDIKLKQGMNVIEFTPDKAGTIRWSCWMGMIPGSFIVTETGNASQNEIAAATPKPSGSCGCGG